MSRIPFFFAVSGYKNSGKTTLLVQLIEELTSRGIKVAVIKHDGHDFEADIPGTDSYRHKQAGAYATAVFSAKRMLVHKETAGLDENQLAALFPEADMILLEGFKNSGHPKYVCRYPAEEPISPQALADHVIALWKKSAT